MKDFTWYENYPETQKVFLTSFCFVLPKQKGVFFYVRERPAQGKPEVCHGFEPKHPIVYVA